LIRIGSVLNRVRFGSGSGSGCSYLVHFESDCYGSGLNWVGSFQVWVISVHARFQVAFGYGLGCFAVWVEISLSHFECQFGYGSGLFGSSFGSQVNFAMSKPRSRASNPWLGLLVNVISLSNLHLPIALLTMI